MDERREFLIYMYVQLWNNINRHILIPWQSITVVIGTFALFSFVEKNVISLDIAAAFIVLISAWQIAHVCDSSAWVNRNHAIIINIERQFLNPEDSKYIHHFFVSHRPWSLFDNFKIQQALGYGLWVLILIYHFEVRILPGLGEPLRLFKVSASLPYLATIPCIIYLSKLIKKQAKRHQEFLEKSPGIEIRNN